MIVIWDSKMQPKVPCNGCRECCINDNIALEPAKGDRYSDHRGNVWALGGRMYLKRKANGECVYLDEQGCSLYGDPRRPRVCLQMDCRVVAKMTNWKPREGVIRQSVIDAARRLTNGH